MAPTWYSTTPSPVFGSASLEDSSLDTVGDRSDPTRSEGHSDATALGTPFASVPFVGQNRPFARSDIYVSECPDCRKLSLWASGLCVYPRACVFRSKVITESGRK